MHKEILIYLLGAVLVGSVAYGYYHQRNIHARYIEFRENEKQIDAVRRDIEALKERVDQVKDRVENMKDDPVEIEATIRRIRRLTRDGEVIFHIEDAPVAVEQQAPAPPLDPATTAE
jgi:cell division protein FtsB